MNFRFSKDWNSFLFGGAFFHDEGYPGWSEPFWVLIVHLGPFALTIRKDDRYQ